MSLEDAVNDAFDKVTLLFFLILFGSVVVLVTASVVNILPLDIIVIII